MAFGDLSSNQMVSYAEASTSTFTLVPGESHFTTLPAANQCMTKSNALAKYVLNAANMAGYSDNQLVPKSAWTPGVSYGYTFYTQDSFSATGSCMVSGSTFTLYSGDTSLAVNSRLYQDINLTDTFYAGEIEGDWFHSTDNKTYRIQNYWDPDSTYDPKIAEIKNCFIEFGTAFNWHVYAIEYQPDGKILVGGGFTTYKGVTVNGIVRLFSDGTLDTDFIEGSNFNQDVYCIKVLSDGRIAVGGNFQQYNGTTVNRFVILNTNGNIDTTFGTGFNSNVRTIAVKGSYMYVGGAFTSYNGNLYNGIASFNPVTGTTNPNFTVGTGFTYPSLSANAIVSKIYIGTDNWIYIGGFFSTYRGSAANSFIRVSDAGSLSRNFNIGPSGAFVEDIVSIDNGDKVVCVGEFTTAGGTTANRIAAFDYSGQLYNVFGTGFNSRVYKINVVEDNKILVSGAFGTYNGQSVKVSIKLFFGLQIYNKDINFNPDFNNVVGTHAIDADNNITYGGAFTVVADTAVSRSSNYIAQFSSEGVLISI